MVDRPILPKATTLTTVICSRCLKTSKCSTTKLYQTIQKNSQFMNSAKCSFGALINTCSWGLTRSFWGKTLRKDQLFIRYPVYAASTS